MHIVPALLISYSWLVVSPATVAAVKTGKKGIGSPSEGLSPESFAYEGIKTANSNIIKKLKGSKKKNKDKNKDKNKNKEKTEVIIGGAGWSGVTLSKTLDEADVDFIVLEASDDIGGRMRNINFGANENNEEGYSIELGATWIDGLEGSPSWELRNEVNLDGTLQFFGFEFYDENGDRDLFNEFFEEGSECLNVDTASNVATNLTLDCLQLSEGDEVLNEELCNRLTNGADFVPEDDDDINEEEEWFLATGFKVENEINPTSARACQTFYHDFEQGISTRRTSANNSVPLNAYEDFGAVDESSDFWVGDPRGFAWLPKYQASLFLNTSVRTDDTIVFDDNRLRFKNKIIIVKWDPEGKKRVEVTVCKTIEDKMENGQVFYPCLPRSFKIRGNEFVSTFSNQVLKKSLELELENVSFRDSRDIAPRFDPPLSSIDGMQDVLLPNELGIYTKVFLQFTEKFWNTTSEYFVSAASGEGYNGDFAPIWSNYDQEGQYPGSRILLLYTFSERAVALAKENDDDILEKMLPVLSDIFKENIMDTYGVEELSSDHVTDFFVTRWTEDPLFRGGFEASVFGINVDQAALLGKRFGNLVLSGGSSCLRHKGWTHGALLAGERTGMQLLKERYGFDELDVNSLCDAGDDF